MVKRDRNIQNDVFKTKRRMLRSLPTKAEYVLWQELRRKLLGYKFRRQTSIGKYIVDFYCNKLMLIIEVDGPIHEQQICYDIDRENWLKAHGYIVMRFLNDEVLFNREVVIQRIIDLCLLLDKK